VLLLQGDFRFGSSMNSSIMKSNDHASAVLFYNWLLLCKKRCQAYVS